MAHTQPPLHIQTITVRGRQYRRQIRYVYDPARGRTVPQLVQQLGPVAPVYSRRTPRRIPFTAPPRSFDRLTNRIMAETLTPAQVIDLVAEMGEELDPEQLSAVGIRFDLGEKTLELLLWNRPSSSHPRHARSVRRPGRSSAPPRPPTSHSKGRVD